MNKKVCILTILVILVVLPNFGKKDIPQPTIEQVAKNAWVVGGNYFDEHMTVVETSVGLVIVDTLTHAPATARAMKLVRQYTKKPVRYVINTHFDVDHYGGNQLFPKATIIGHINCQKHYDNQLFNKKENAKNMRDYIQALDTIVPGNDPASLKRRKTYAGWYETMLEGFSDFTFTPPNRFVTENETITCGNTRFRLLHFGPGHTDADLVVFFPREKIVVTGDLVLGENTVPVIHRIHGGDIIHMISILGEIKKIVRTGSVVVPGHSTCEGIGVIKDQQDYLIQLIDQVNAAQKSGLDLKTAKDRIPMAAYKNHWLYEMVHQGNIETAWHQLKESK